MKTHREGMRGAGSALTLDPAEFGYAVDENGLPALDADGRAILTEEGRRMRAEAMAHLREERRRYREKYGAPKQVTQEEYDAFGQSLRRPEETKSSNVGVPDGDPIPPKNNGGAQ